LSAIVTLAYSVYRKGLRALPEVPSVHLGPAMRARQIEFAMLYTRGGRNYPMATVRATVEIFGQRLGLRADGDEARVQEIARFVDFRMREVADRSSSVDSVKIAVLTALNIADELFQERETDQDTRQQRLEKQAKRLVLKIEEAMKPGKSGKDS
jgi:cell division protein ZapA